MTPRNHLAYSQVIIEALQAQSQLTWHDAASLLVHAFGWTHKTASNRIHELRQAEIIVVEGVYRKGLFGREEPDTRVLKLPPKKI
ncbi:MAG: hypothetical protein F2851_05425 [Actinobacteria bacterium]|uniref:Unannotated protein n=1 Tax=freshwater metagenome TaxID=449393 RepID=A0A6J5ZHK6_9ZZZZ|nr:hypothetical protein [Actinomycetota bacterium]